MGYRANKKSLRNLYFITKTVENYAKLWKTMGFITFLYTFLDNLCINIPLDIYLYICYAFNISIGP
jgi:hypothetical protein